MLATRLPYNKRQKSLKMTDPPSRINFNVFGNYESGVPYTTQQLKVDSQQPKLQ
jgi:hypothetical protein